MVDSDTRKRENWQLLWKWRRRQVWPTAYREHRQARQPSLTFSHESTLIHLLSVLTNLTWQFKRHETRIKWDLQVRFLYLYIIKEWLVENNKSKSMFDFHCIERSFFIPPFPSASWGPHTHAGGRKELTHRWWEKVFSFPPLSQTPECYHHGCSEPETKASSMTSADGDMIEAVKNSLFLSHWKIKKECQTKNITKEDILIMRRGWRCKETLGGSARSCRGQCESTSSNSGRHARSHSSCRELQPKNILEKKEDGFYYFC